jgi:hypothetical protein
MRTALPPITDHTDELQHRLPREHDGHTKPRLQRLDLLASGPAHTRQDGAHWLGGHRHPIGRWLATSAAGGSDALLATDVPAGKPVSLAPAGRAGLEQALRRPAGFASYEDAAGSGRRLGWRSRTRRSTPSCAHASGPRAQGRAPATPKNPQAIPAFQTTCRARLERAIPPENRRPVRVLSQDDSRFGWLTGRRRR